MYSPNDMSNSLCQYLTKFHHLSDGRICVICFSHTSDSHVINSNVPQDPIPSPTLLLLQTKNVVLQLNNFDIQLFRRLDTLLQFSNLPFDKQLLNLTGYPRKFPILIHNIYNVLYTWIQKHWNFCLP